MFLAHLYIILLKLFDFAGKLLCNLARIYLLLQLSLKFLCQLSGFLDLFGQYVFAIYLLLQFLLQIIDLLIKFVHFLRKFGILIQKLINLLFSHSVI